MSKRRSSSHHQSESTMSSPVDSGCSPDYFGDDMFPPIDPPEDPVGPWTQAELLVQDVDPFGFTNQEGLQDVISGSMPQMAMDLPVLDVSDDVGSLISSGEVLSHDQAQLHSFISDVESSSADTSGGNNSGSENSERFKFEEDPLIRMKRDECVEDGIFFCNWGNCHKQFGNNSERTKHLRSHYKPVYCPWPGCTHKSAWPREMRKHFNSHRSKKSYKCPLCPIMFTRNYNLPRHLREVHGGERRPRRLEMR
ncbi:hypothetical protein NCS57_01148000 [Fusarium keratoplasticum]|uniref:Uncharacterized protein n=1 Tax=Fusarium keratoplasticum TaxID=1328300 RepID=A0ACC0QLT6_9HYPO|nr:hypothetical protein NCS57_01148000 [Fusarium keratoplasticum]KAI8657693.1 hypothetical protein NCS57_01148000 [Fusarium keratoplasticum]KAI8658657.1 hypothetical protein NCS55_01142600 [Fusarium keratoplasticum]